MPKECQSHHVIIQFSIIIMSNFEVHYFGDCSKSTGCTYSQALEKVYEQGFQETYFVYIMPTTQTSQLDGTMMLCVLKV